MSDATVCPECGGAPWSTPNGCFCAQRKVLTTRTERCAEFGSHPVSGHAEALRAALDTATEDTVGGDT